MFSPVTRKAHKQCRILVLVWNQGRTTTEEQNKQVLQEQNEI